MDGTYAPAAKDGAGLQRSPRGGPEAARKPAFQPEIEIGFAAHRDVGRCQLGCLLGYVRTTEPPYASAMARQVHGNYGATIGSEEHSYGLIEAHFVDAPIAELRSGGLTLETAVGRCDV